MANIIKSAANAPKDKVFTAIFLLDMVAYFSSTCDTYLFSSTFTTIASTMGGNLAIAGTLAGIYSVAAIIMRPFAGALIDKFGKQKCIIASLILCALGVVGYAISTTIEILFVFRIIHGVCFSVTTAAFYGSAADLVPETRKTFGLGWFSNMATIASYVGPVIGTWGLAQWNATGSWTPFYIAAICVLMCGAILGFFIRYEKKPEYQEKLATARAAQKKAKTLSEAELKELEAFEPPRPKVKKFFGLPAYAWLLVLTLILVSGAHCSVGNFLIVAAKERGLEGVGNYFLMQTIGMFIARGVVTHLIDRLGPFKVAVPVLLIGAISFVCMANASDISLFLIIGIPYGFMFGTIAPTVNSLIASSCGAANNGKGAAMYLLSIDLGYGFFPTLWGAVIMMVGYANVYLYAAICPILAIGVIALYWFKWGKTIHASKLQWEKERAAQTNAVNA